MAIYIYDGAMWSHNGDHYNQSDKLNRAEQVILFRLRTGHNRLNAHMYNKLKVCESEVCPCDADIMTAEHLLQLCRLHDALRWDMWPDSTQLRDNLYGNLEELRRTAAFMRATGDDEEEELYGNISMTHVYIAKGP